MPHILPLVYGFKILRAFSPAHGARQSAPPRLLLSCLCACARARAWGSDLSAGHNLNDDRCLVALPVAAVARQLERAACGEQLPCLCGEGRAGTVLAASSHDRVLLRAPLPWLYQLHLGEGEVWGGGVRCEGEV